MFKLFVAAAFAGLVGFVVAQPVPKAATPAWPDPLGYVCHRAEKPPVIDGKLDDAVWASVPWSSDFQDIEGDAKPKPRHRTRMKMLWDDECLYIAAELEEPHVWANLTEHDSIVFMDNDFEVFLDPDGDNHNYAEMEINARNTTWDLLLTKPYKDGGHAINGWEIIGLKTAVHVDGTLNDSSDKDRGWTLEIAWPWKGLKEISNVPVPPRDGDQWRINFSRVEWDTEIVGGKYVKVKGKPENNWVWSPQGVVNMHVPERWGYLQFSTGAAGKVAFKPDPERVTRDSLHRLYYAQTDYRKAHGKYTAVLTDLGLPANLFSVAPTIETTRSGFEASVAGSTRWSISQDSQIWGEKKR